MKIKNYNDFLISEKYNFKYDNFAHQFAIGNVSEKQFEDYLFSYVTNEGIMDTVFSFGQDFNKAISLIQEKVLNAFFTFVVDARQVGIKIITKVIAGASKLFKWVKNFQQKHPVLFKAIGIFILIVIFLILSSQGAHAANTVNDLATGAGDAANNIPSEDDMKIYQGAIGYVQHMIDSGHIHKGQLSAKVISTIVDLSDGKLDNPKGYSTEGVRNIAQMAIDEITRLRGEAIEGDKSSLSGMIKLIAQGAKIAPITGH